MSKASDNYISFRHDLICRGHTMHTDVTNYIKELEQQIKQITAMENVAVERTVRLEKEKADLIYFLESLLVEFKRDKVIEVLKKYSGETI